MRRLETKLALWFERIGIDLIPKEETFAFVFKALHTGQALGLLNGMLISVFSIT